MTQKHQISDSKVITVLSNAGNSPIIKWQNQSVLLLLIHIDHSGIAQGTGASFNF